MDEQPTELDWVAKRYIDKVAGLLRSSDGADAFTQAHLIYENMRMKAPRPFTGDPGHAKCQTCGMEVVYETQDDIPTNWICAFRRHDQEAEFEDGRVMTVTDYSTYLWCSERCAAEFQWPSPDQMRMF